MSQDTEPLVVAYHQDSKDSLTKYDLGVLAVRMTGLYLLSLALSYASYIPGAMAYTGRGGPPWAIIVMYSGPAVVDGLAGALLLTCTSTIVRRVFPEFSAGASLSVTGRDLQAVAFSVIGVWLVVSAIPDVISMAAQYWWLGGTTTRQPFDTLPNTLKLLAQIVAGVILFARAKGLSALWHWMRYAGITQAPAANARDGRPE